LCHIVTQRRWKTGLKSIAIQLLNLRLGFPSGSDCKESACNVGDPCSIPGLDPLEKGMVTHSSILPWRSPWMEEPDGLKSMGLQRVGHHGVIMNKCKKSKLYWTRPRVQLLSGVQLFETPWTAVHKAFLSITNSQRLLTPMSLALVMPSNHLILCPPFLSSICHSIRVLFSESVLHMGWPKYWS